MRPVAAAVFASTLLTASAFAAPPTAHTIAERMKAALEPDRSSTRSLVIDVHSAGETVEWTGREARKKLADGKRMLTVLLAPPDVKGVALLIRERPQEAGDGQWLYLPYLRRVRAILPLGAFESFLGTDFTTADLGFVDLRHRTFALLGEEKPGNVRTYKVEETLENPRYYSRIVTWVAADDMLPVRRDYYDVANRLWKTARYTDVQTVAGVPTPLRIRMEDVQQGTSTELRMRDVRYDVHIPDNVFDPARLPQTVRRPP